ARNIYASFGDSSVNECTIQSWSTKFQSGDKSLANEDSDWPETVAYNKVLPAIVQQNSGNPVKTTQRTRCNSYDHFLSPKKD
ncbi:hypothetical protein TNCT_429031, partial [Trichonephila clavata]